MKANYSRPVRAAQSFAAIAVVLCVQHLSADTIEGNLEKSFTARAGGTLLVDVDQGSIDITTSERSNVAITVKRSVTGASKSRGQEILDQHEITFDQDGERVEVHAKSNRKWHDFLRGGLGYHVQYQIAVPKQFNLDLRTSAGSITSQDIEGTVKAKTSGGSLKFAAIKGSLDANTSAGSIHLTSASGPVSVKTSGGGIELGELDGDATAITSAGSISINNAKGKLMAKTSGGGIELGELAAPADVETSAGSIHVKSARSSLVAKTSGGSIKIDDAKDTIVAHTSAGKVSAVISSAPHGDCSLTSSGGGIEIKLGENLGFNVEARTSGGQVHSEIAVASNETGEKKHSVLKGELNGGGKALLLKTSAGNINIRKL